MPEAITALTHSELQTVLESTPFKVRIAMLAEQAGTALKEGAFSLTKSSSGNLSYTHVYLPETAAENRGLDPNLGLDMSELMPRKVLSAPTTVAHFHSHPYSGTPDSFTSCPSPADIKLLASQEAGHIGGIVTLGTPFRAIQLLLYRTHPDLFDRNAARKLPAPATLQQSRKDLGRVGITSAQILYLPKSMSSRYDRDALRAMF